MIKWKIFKFLLCNLLPWFNNNLSNLSLIRFSCLSNFLSTILIGFIYELGNKILDFSKVIITDLLGNKSSILQQMNKGNFTSSTLKPNLIFSRYYSTSSKNPNYSPEVIYLNSDLDKERILKENKGKSGVYLWKNLLNNKIYVGSSTNLSRRFSFYFSIKSLLNYKSQSILIKGLLKYGYSSFKVEILEYCEPKRCLEIEQKYINLLNPEYNILKTVGSTLGFKHREGYKEKIKISKNLKFNTAAGKVTVSKPVAVTDTLTSTTTSYPSIIQAEAALKASKGSLNKCLKTNKKLYKKRYLISLLAATS